MKTCFIFQCRCNLNVMMLLTYMIYNINLFIEHSIYHHSTDKSDLDDFTESDDIYSTFELDPSVLSGEGHYKMAVESLEDRYVIEVTGKTLYDDKEKTYRYEQLFED